MGMQSKDLSRTATVPERESALRLLLTRYSVSAKHLGEPGPSPDEIWTMAMAALRAPDHKKRIPFRFVIARDVGLERLADLFEDYGRRKGKSGDDLAAERARAMQAPVAIAVIARIGSDDPEVPPFEQWACVGGAIGNALNALHFMGYSGKMVSGARAADPAIVAAYCGSGETLVGWIAAGTAKGPAKPRGEVDPCGIIAEF
ncbi:MAG TPA: nitroreductase family protein [Usitatibacteraceae bacterium]|nr:nitroreductase family protein [Usitatibacteraceae bacterium]